MQQGFRSIPARVLPALVGALLLGSGASPAAEAGALRVRVDRLVLSGSLPEGAVAHARGSILAALERIGLQIAREEPFDATTSVRCTCAASSAACAVWARHVETNRTVIREVDLSYRTAEELAEALALVVSDATVRVLRPPLQQAPGSPEEVRSDAPDDAGKASRWSVWVGPTVELGFADGPTLWGAVVALRARLSGMLALEGHLRGTGAADDYGPHHLAFGNGVAGLRVLLGGGWGRFRLDAGAGIGLSLLYSDANRPGGQNWLVSALPELALQLAGRLTPRLWLALVALAVMPVERQEVRANDQTLLRFERVRLGLTLRVGVAL